MELFNYVSSVAVGMPDNYACHYMVTSTSANHCTLKMSNFFNIVDLDQVFSYKFQS